MTSRKLKCKRCPVVRPTRTVISGVVVWLHDRITNCPDAELLEKEWQARAAEIKANEVGVTLAR